MRPAPPLRPHLDDPLVFAGRLHHAPAFDEIVRNRLLDIDVLARLARPNRGQGMPVIGGSYDKGGDVRVFKNAAHVFFDLWDLLLMFIHRLESVGDDVIIGIANRGDLDAIARREPSYQIQASPVDAHDGQHNLIVGLIAHRRRPHCRKSRDGGGGRLQEFAAMQ